MSITFFTIFGSFFFKRLKEIHMSGSEVEPIRKWSPHCICKMLLVFYFQVSDWTGATYQDKRHLGKLKDTGITFHFVFEIFNLKLSKIIHEFYFIDRKIFLCIWWGC